MVRACHTARQPLKNHPSGHLGGWATPLSADETLDGQHQRVDIPAGARIAHRGLLHKRLEEDLSWLVSRVSTSNQFVKRLNGTTGSKIQVNEKSIFRERDRQTERHGHRETDRQTKYAWHYLSLQTGVVHTDDVAYVFGMPLTNDPSRTHAMVSSWTDDDKHVSQQLMTLWTNFAKYG